MDERMTCWRADRTRFLATHPYEGPYPTRDEAERWCESIRRVHTDCFTVREKPEGFVVVQDVGEKHG
jgi:hypothetical protein